MLYSHIPPPDPAVVTKNTSVWRILASRAGHNSAVPSGDAPPIALEHMRAQAVYLCGRYAKIALRIAYPRNRIIYAPINNTRTGIYTNYAKNYDVVGLCSRRPLININSAKNKTVGVRMRIRVSHPRFFILLTRQAKYKHRF